MARLRLTVGGGGASIWASAWSRQRSNLQIQLTRDRLLGTSALPARCLERIPGPKLFRTGGVQGWVRVTGGTVGAWLCDR